MYFLSLFPIGEQGLFIFGERRIILCMHPDGDGDRYLIPSITQIF